MEPFTEKVVEYIKYLFEQIGYKDLSLDTPLLQLEVEPIDMVFVKRILEEQFELPEDTLIKEDAQEEKDTISTIALSITTSPSETKE